MITIEQIVPILQGLGTSLLAGLAYSMSGYINYVIEQRKLNADAPFDWKKLGATATVAVIVGIIIGLAQSINGSDIAVSYEFMIAVGLNTLIKKWVSILWYGQEVTLGKVTGKLFRKG